MAHFFLSSFSFSIKLTMKGFPLLLFSYIAVVSAYWYSAQEEGSRLKILVFTYSVFAVLLGKGGIPCRY